jgi:hypothetical protein
MFKNLKKKLLVVMEEIKALEYLHLMDGALVEEVVMENLVICYFTKE